MGARGNYGKLRSIEQPEAYRIWLTRNDEPAAQLESVENWLQTPTDDAMDASVEAQMVMRQARGCLKPQELLVVLLRHRDGWTLPEIATIQLLSVERIRQIEAKAMSKLRRRLRVAVRVSEVPSESCERPHWYPYVGLSIRGRIKKMEANVREIKAGKVYYTVYSDAQLGAVGSYWCSIQQWLDLASDAIHKHGAVAFSVLVAQPGTTARGQ